LHGTDSHIVHIVSLLEIFARNGAQSAADVGGNIRLLNYFGCQKRVLPGVILVRTPTKENANNAPRTILAALRPSTTSNLKSCHWKIEREVAGIVLRFSEVSTCFLKNRAAGLF